MDTTSEQTNTERARALIKELRELTGARAIVFWTAHDILADCDSITTLAEADSWLEEHEDGIEEAMCQEAWQYIREFLPGDDE